MVMAFHIFMALRQSVPSSGARRKF